MNKEKRLFQLIDISQMILDGKLGALHVIASRRQHSMDILSELDKALPEDSLSIVAAYQTNQRYQIWVDARRSEVNSAIARQTAEMHGVRDEAKQALGKNQALRRLYNKTR